MRYYIIPLDILKKGARNLSCPHINCSRTSMLCTTCIVRKADPELEQLALEAFQRWQHDTSNNV